MRKGTIEEIVLTRSVTKHIRKHNKGLVVGAGVGNDYSAVSFPFGDIISCEATSTDIELALIKAMNNFATSGGEAMGIRVLFLLSKACEEQDVKKYMSKVNSFADENGIQIMGGHTEVTTNETTYFCITVIGLSKDYKAKIKTIKPGYDIVMTKYAGLYGSDYIADKKKDNLSKRFAGSYIANALFGFEQYSVVPEARIASLDENVCYMHDVSTGGVYGALWQLGSRINKGILVYNSDIPIKQETIEFCELFDINPYMLEGTGALLVVSSDGQSLVDELMSKEIFACVIGKVTDSKEKCIDTGSEKRFLSPVKGDDIDSIKNNKPLKSKN